MKQLILQILILGLAASAAHAWDSSENSIRFDGYLKGEVTDSVSIKLSEHLRYRDKGNFNYYRHTEIGAEWKFIKDWAAALGYRYIMARKPDSEWVGKPMVHVNLKNKLTVSIIELKSRLRFSYLFLDNSEDLTDCRPKFALMPSKGWTGWKLKPYAAIEGVYDFEENFAYRYRAGGGLQLAPLKKIALNFFMVQERTRLQKNSRWNESFFMGLQAGLTF